MTEPERLDPSPDWVTFEEIKAEPPLSAYKPIARVPISHETLVDFDPTHVCDEACPPPYVPPPLPWPRRVRYFLRRRWWGVKRIGGYRLVHKDRIDRDCD